MADVGSGTGKLTELFLDWGCRVFGVEPNEDMRREAQRAFAGRDDFVSVNGTVEFSYRTVMDAARFAD